MPHPVDPVSHDEHRERFKGSNKRDGRGATAKAHKVGVLGHGSPTSPKSSPGASPGDDLGFGVKRGDKTVILGARQSVEEKLRNPSEVVEKKYDEKLDKHPLSQPDA